MSRAPTIAPPPIPPRATAQDEVLEERTYTLITPLFGGGVRARRADPVSLIRVTSIRGQLRFWWRATRGLGRIAEMRQKEAQLWGAASSGKEGQPSQVQLELVQVSGGVEERPYVLSRGNPASSFMGIESPHYAAFPLQPSTQELKGVKTPEQEAAVFAPVLKQVRFTLRIRAPKACQPDLAATLWAWETFGGVGARTRRGFGALRLDELKRNGGLIPVAALRPPSASSVDMDRWMERNVAEHVLEGQRGTNFPFVSRRNSRWRCFSPGEIKSGWPRVRMSLGKIQADEKTALEKLPPGPIMAWHFLIQQLRRFRQDRPAFPYENSTWPEADALRSLTGQSYPKHAPSVRGVSVMKVFPRAELGLPIVLHFKDGPDKTGKTSAGAMSAGRGPGEKRLVGRGLVGSGSLRPAPGSAAQGPDSDRTDPADHSLLGQEVRGQRYERFASPILLRPVVCADGQCGAVALHLQGPIGLPVPLMLRQESDGAVVATELRQAPTGAEAEKIPMLLKHREHLKPTPSAARAFMNTLRTVEETPKKGG